MNKRFTLILFFVLLFTSAGIYTWNKFFSYRVGDKIDELNGVAVYYNGVLYTKSFGNSYNDDSFYYGKKWQCVEFVKRYYHDALNHTMPDGFGNAKDFFDKKLKSGSFNKKRGLLQFSNGDTTKPKVDDLLVFDGKYGHVAKVSKVNENEIEIVQQNIFNRPRETMRLDFIDRKYFIEGKKKLLGWLRLK